MSNITGYNGHSYGYSSGNYDKDLKDAIALSLKPSKEDEDLALALKLSREEQNVEKSSDSSSSSSQTATGASQKRKIKKEHANDEPKSKRSSSGAREFVVIPDEDESTAAITKVFSSSSSSSQTTTGTGQKRRMLRKQGNDEPQSNRSLSSCSSNSSSPSGVREFVAIPSEDESTAAISSVFSASSSTSSSISDLSDHASDSRKDIESSEKIISKIKAEEPKTSPKKTLFTVKIRNTDMLERVKNIAKSWMEAAQKRAELAHKSKDKLSQIEFDGYKDIVFNFKDSSITLPFKDQLASSSLRVLIEIYFNHGTDNTYVTYDEHNKIQAIAIASVGVGRAVIKDLAANPNNLVIFADDDVNPVRGAGTALVRHIALESKKYSREGSISLEADDAAVQYWEKRGFKRLFNGSNCMNLDNENMNRLLESYKDLAVVVENPPENLS